MLRNYDPEYTSRFNKGIISDKSVDGNLALLFERVIDLKEAVEDIGLVIDSDSVLLALPP